MLIYIGYALTVLMGLAIIVIGGRAILDPRGAAAGFGVPVREGDDVDPYLAIKGVRDIGTGLIGLALLIAQQRYALGWFFVTAAFIPLGDAVIVLRRGGSKAVAFGIHGATAAMMLLTAALLLLG